jgi:hypothetical protein
MEEELDKEDIKSSTPKEKDLSFYEKNMKFISLYESPNQNTINLHKPVNLMTFTESL